MKAIKAVLLSCLIICTVSCSNTSSNNKNYYVYENHQYPKELGEPTIQKDDISSIKEDIAFKSVNNYGDLLVYLLEKDLTDEKEIIDKSLELLYGDFDDLGIVELENNTLIYLKTNDQYYPIDVINYKETKWLSGFNLNSLSFETLSDLENCFHGNASSICKEDYKLKKDPYLVINDEKIVEYEKYNEPVYLYKGFEFPVALGYPKLTDEELSNISFSTAPAKITTYPDAVVFLYNNLHNIVMANPPTDIPKENAITEYGFLTKYIEIIMGDYPEVGSIEMTAGDATGGACTFMLYIKAHNEKYYWLDWYSQVLRENKEWLGNYVGYKYEGASYCFENREDLKQAMKDETVNPCYSLFKPYSNSISMWSLRTQSDENYKAPVNLETHTISLLDGSTQETFYRLDTECYNYCGTQIPLGTGLPVLTYDEIDDLLSSNDLNLVQEKITTIADLCCYLVRGNFIFIPDAYADAIHFQELSDDNWGYAVSAKQFNNLRFGSCMGSSNFANYILKDDYDDFGIIHVWYEESGGHVEIYLKSNGIYYLFNPSSQFLLDYNLKCPDLWLKEYTVVDTGSSDSLDELIAALISSNNPGTPDKTVKHCFTIDTYANYCYTGYGTYPSDFKVKAWTNSSISQGTPAYDYKSNTYEFDYDISILPENIRNNIH